MHLVTVVGCQGDKILAQLAGLLYETGSLNVLHAVRIGFAESVIFLLVGLCFGSGTVVGGTALLLFSLG